MAVPCKVYRDQSPAALVRPTTQERTIRLLTRQGEYSGVFTFRITAAGESTVYVARPVESDFGRAWCLRKMGPGDTVDVMYDVCLGGAPGNGDACNCKGWVRWGRCRHVSGIKALLAAGRIV